MRRMGGETQYRRADGHQGVSRAGNHRCVWVKQPPGEEKEQQDCSQVDDQQAEMNSGWGLSENRHQQSISGVGAGEFDVIDQLIGRDAFEDKLAGIGVLSFVSFQRNRQKPDPNANHKQHRQSQADPRPGRGPSWFGRGPGSILNLPHWGGS